MEETYFTLQEIADKLKVHYRTVYRWVQDGKLEAYQFGQDYRVKASDIEKFIAERRIKDRRRRNKDRRRRNT